MPYSDNLILTLNNLANAYRGKMESSLKSMPKVGRGLQRVTVTVIPGNANSSPALSIKVDDYVTILDRSKLQWTLLPNTGNLLTWARTKKSNETEAKQLAFATAYKKKKTDDWKPKKWRKKGIGSVLKQLNEEMLKAFDEAIEKDFQVEIDKALK